MTTNKKCERCALALRHALGNAERYAQRWFDTSP
jgi:hypothetical protein